MNRIKQLRQDYGLTQQELAKKLNCSKSVIGLYENEMRKPSIDVLLKMAEIFGCQTDYILGKSDIKKIEEVNFAYHKATEGLSDEEIKEALEFYRKIKYGELGKKEEK